MSQEPLRILRGLRTVGACGGRLGFVGESRGQYKVLQGAGVVSTLGPSLRLGKLLVWDGQRINCDPLPRFLPTSDLWTPGLSLGSQTDPRSSA